jgi:FixJ family two-component response regulator
MPTPPSPFPTAIADASPKPPAVAAAVVDNAETPHAEPTPDAQIFLVDDNDAFRASTRWLLQGHGYRVDAFSEPRHFLAYVDAGPPRVSRSCVLLDIRMPEMSGLEVQDALRQRGCDLPIVFISGHGDVPLAVEVMRRGAIHFLEKPFNDDALIAALEDALQRAENVAQQGPGDEQATRRLARLTARERQVLDLVVKGKLNKVIADQLGISIKTVELHRSRVMQKMQATSIAQLVQIVVSARSPDAR